MDLVLAFLSRDEPFAERVMQAVSAAGSSFDGRVYRDVESCLDGCGSKTSDAVSAVIVDQQSQGVANSALFYQKFRDLRVHRFTPIVAVEAKITPLVLGMSSEYGFFRVLDKSHIDESLSTVLEALSEELSKPSGLRQSFHKMAQALASGHEGEANRILEECYQVYRDDLEVLCEYGNMCLRKGKLERAERVFSKLEASSGQSLRVSNFLARVELKRGRFNEALAILDRANVLSPSNLERLLLMGDAFRVSGDMTKAEQKYEEALWIDQNNPAAKKGLGLVALEQGEADRALDFFKGTCTEEEIASFMNNTAVLAARRSHFEQAKGLYGAASRALSDAKIRSKVEFNMGLLYRRWNKNREALTHFKEAIVLDPENEKADRHLSLVRATIDDEIPAREAAEGAGAQGQIAAESPNFDEFIEGDEAPGAFAESDLDQAASSDAGAESVSDQAATVREKSVGTIHQVEEPSEDIKPFSVGSMLANIPPPSQQKKKENRPNTKKSQQPKSASDSAAAGFIDDEDSDEEKMGSSRSARSKPRPAS